MGTKHGIGAEFERRRVGGLLLMASGGLKIAAAQIRGSPPPLNETPPGRGHMLDLLDSLERILYREAVNSGALEEDD